MIHELKILPEYFKAKIDGIKPWEYRVNDREFGIGDILRLCEFDPVHGFSGRAILVKITYMILVKNNYVIMSDDSGTKINWVSTEIINKA